MFSVPKPRLTRVTVAGGVAATAVLLLAGTASAHVTVQPQGDAVKGGSAIIAFKVPNERDNASTSKLEVDFPTDHPLASVMPEPVPGWKITLTKTKLAKPVQLYGNPVNEAVTKVTWTADPASKIPPGEFQRFPVAVTPLPTDDDQVVFKALQTYDNKEVVRWIEKQTPGGAEPENPAPVLKLTAAPATTGQQGATPAKPAAAKESDDRAADVTNGPDNLARVLGGIGILVGVLGVAYGAVAGRRRTA